ncbi:MAG: type II toxin-antitoxin system MqsA family antitoxin [Candidatus Lindowbacteria bacterium]|nr:type II toxin-antitoxin system MqsA family antitoxin [Candidatus Lindowbacteria bacterium]
MKEARDTSLCPVCGGRKKNGRVLYSVDMGFGVVIVRNVPAKVCGQCGEEWIAPDTALKLEKLTEQARKKRHQVEVLAM